MQKRRCLSIFLCFLVFSWVLTGCASGATVETLNNWSFQYNESTSDYHLFFGLLNNLDSPTSADCTVKIRIVNDNNETVFDDAKFITTDDFGYFSNAYKDDMYLADVRIKADEIESGSSASGTVYFTVECEYAGFDEVNCTAYSCLPVADIELVTDSLPIDLIQEGVMGGIEGSYTVTSVDYSVDTSLTSSLTFVVSGEKTGGESGSMSYDMIMYKLYDSNEYLVDSGQIFLGNGLSVGDKFKSDVTYVYDVTPGETYTLILSDYVW